MNTASALKSVCATLYGTSSYNNDFSSTLSPPDQKHSTQSTPIHHEITDTLDVPTLQEPPKNGESCGKCKFGTEDCHLQKNEGYQDQEIDDSCSSSDSNDDEESGSDDPEQTAASASNITSTTHGHMISISPCTNTLPSHVIVTSLSELPSHFRRVTTKYTRNRCPLLPCRVPHYLLRKHQLLPSVITKLPISKRSGQQLPAMTKDALILPAMAKSLAVNYHQSWSDPGKISATANDGQISAMSLRDAQFSATTKDTAVSYHANLSGFGEKPAATDDVNNGYVDNRLSHLVNDQEAGKNSKNSKDGKGSAISDLNGRHFHHHHHHHRDHLLAGEVTSKPVTQDRVVANGTTMQPEVKGRMRQHSHMTQHLGQKFKTDAHTRYIILHYCSIISRNNNNYFCLEEQLSLVIHD